MFVLIKLLQTYIIVITYINQSIAKPIVVKNRSLYLTKVVYITRYIQVTNFNI